MSRRLALGVSIPAVILFVGIIVALLIPSNRFVITESLDAIGLLGARARDPDLIADPPGAGEAAPIWLTGGRLWDADGGARPNPGLGCAAGRFTDRRPPGAREVAIGDATILPGLIDMHVHAPGGTFDGEMMIAAGVTTARDVGSWLPGVRRQREETAAGTRIGPRLLVSGPYLVGGSAMTDQEMGVRGPADADGVVRALAEGGADWIKVHHGIDAATLEALVAAAHARGLRVAAHLDGVDAAAAARAGVDTLEHAGGLDAPGGAPGPDEAARDAGIAAELIAAGTAVVPTLVVAEHAFLIPDRARADAPGLAAIPRFFRRVLIRSQIDTAAAQNLSTAERARRERRLERLLRFVGRFHAAGGRVLAGSDAPAFLVPHGAGLHRELELLVEAGLGPGDALAAATREAARALGREGVLGTLAPGAVADFVVVAGDPIHGPDGIGAIRRVLMVAKEGHIMLQRPD